MPTKHILPGGFVEWRRDGVLHREDGPAVEWPNGIREWFQDGLRHRDDGPAIETDIGGKEWYHRGKLHRVDGPAREGADGTKDWWINGVKVDEATVKAWFDETVAAHTVVQEATTISAPRIRSPTKRKP